MLAVVFYIFITKPVCKSKNPILGRYVGEVL
jgi:hypothetical protein